MTRTDSVMTPREIVHELDRFIIGQSKAKRAVAIALRNRWRRMQLDEEIREEVTPKNILMIGPTGVGKTEIARRLANLANAPFLKIEATKFTEVGYVGRDVDSVIRDLMEVALDMVRDEALVVHQAKAYELAEERVLDILLPPSRDLEISFNDTKQTLRKQLREGDLDDREIEVELSQRPSDFVSTASSPEEMLDQFQTVIANISGGQTKKTRMTVKNAMEKLQEEAGYELLDEDAIRAEAKRAVEETGIVFIDEIDKVAKRSDFGADVSREGVQRDLLPLIEGSTISTKHGMIRTDHILFIASGAFHLSKPSDLIPELQGRLPIRVELEALTTNDFKRILIEPDFSLTEQYKALLAVDNVDISFDEGSLDRIAELAWEVNENTENIGARRLHTVMERLMDEIAYAGGDSMKSLHITKEYVNDQLEELSKDQDLSRYIL